MPCQWLITHRGKQKPVPGGPRRFHERQELCERDPTYAVAWHDLTIELCARHRREAHGRKPSASKEPVLNFERQWPKAPRRNRPTLWDHVRRTQFGCIYAMRTQAAKVSRRRTAAYAKARASAQAKQSAAIPAVYMRPPSSIPALPLRRPKPKAFRRPADVVEQRGEDRYIPVPRF